MKKIDIALEIVKDNNMNKARCIETIQDRLMVTKSNASIYYSKCIDRLTQRATDNIVKVAYTGILSEKEKACVREQFNNTLKELYDSH